MSFKDWLIEELSKLIKERDDVNKRLRDVLSEQEKEIDRLNVNLSILKNVYREASYDSYDSYDY